MYYSIHKTRLFIPTVAPDFIILVEASGIAEFDTTPQNPVVYSNICLFNFRKSSLGCQHNGFKIQYISKLFIISDNVLC